MCCQRGGKHSETRREGHECSAVRGKGGSCAVVMPGSCTPAPPSHAAQTSCYRVPPDDTMRCRPLRPPQCLCQIHAPHRPPRPMIGQRGVLGQACFHGAEDASNRRLHFVDFPSAKTSLDLHCSPRRVLPLLPPPTLPSCQASATLRASLPTPAPSCSSTGLASNHGSLRTTNTRANWPGTTGLPPWESASWRA